MIRPFLTAALCLVAALGHAPAWWHVAQCDGDHGVGVAHAEVTCGHGCHHHHDVVDSSSDRDDRPSTPHDHDRCSICQSLSSASGTVWTPYVGSSSPLIAVLDPEPVVRLSADEFVFPAPRGPPSIA